MKDDPLRLQLQRELRELRRGIGAISLDRVVLCEALVRVVGMGSVEQAHATLIEMFTRHASDPEGDIHAFLETSGIGLSGDSLNKRLDAYSASHHVDQRTALRRSDRGASKLATIFRDETLFFRPWGHLTVVQRDDRAFVVVAIHMDPASEYREPAIWINDKRVEHVEFEFEQPSDSTGYVRALQQFDNIALTQRGAWLLKINVEWRMGVWPQWVLGARLMDPRLAVKLQTQRNFMTEATLIWAE